MTGKLVSAFVAGVVLTVGFPAAAADDAPIEVMILGSTHFDNPGRDAFNIAFDDVLTEARQAQIAEVARALLAFKPTKVAVEWPAEVAERDYAAYRAGTLEASRNEVVQIGFRIAAAQELPTVRGIDVKGDLPFEPLTQYLEQTGDMPKLEADLAALSEQVKVTQSIVDTQSVGAVLRHLNQPEYLARDHAFYRGVLRYGDGETQPGAAMLIAWQARNTEICARLVQAAEPGDRIIVLYGSGHAFLLRQCVSETPGFRVIDALEYLPD